jgi:hypothetical protein
MTDSPFDQHELLEFMNTYLRRLAETGVPTPAEPDPEAPVWRVEELPDGTWAVYAEGTDVADGVFPGRSVAYLAAATFAATGRRPAVSGDPEPAAEVAEPTAAYGDDSLEGRKEVMARTIRGILANRHALELFLEAMDAEVLRDAFSLGQEPPGGDGESWTN